MRISDWSSDVCSSDLHEHAHGGLFGPNTELIFSLICGGALATGFAIEKLTATPSWIPLVCYLVAYLFGGWFTLGEAIENLRLKRFEIDTAMLVAAAGAGAVGAWAGGAPLLRSEEHTSELQSLMRLSYPGFCLEKKKTRASDRSDDHTCYRAEKQ